MPRLTWAFAVCAALLWGTVGASFWVHVNWHVLVLAGPGGAASIVLASMRYMLAAEADRDKDALVRALADLTLRRGLARTRPLKRVV
jgi:hypothetical protein